jgi:tripartite-type tricarboxylate transporter receptor subunit TctC
MRSSTAGSRFSGRRQGRRSRATAGAVTAALIAVPLAVSACSSSSTSSATAAGAAASGTAGASGSGSGAAFFSGKKITLIAPDAAGGSHAEFAAIVAPYIGSYLHTQVAVENVAAGHTIAGQAQLEAAKPDGLTIGLTDVGSYMQDVLGGTSSLKVNPADLGQLGSLPPAADAVIVSNNSPYKTFADLLNTKDPVKALLLPGVGSSEMQGVFQAYNINVHYTTGYANAKDLLAGFVRGDGDVVTTNLLNTGQVVSAGKARAILVTSAVPASSKTFAGVQTLQDFVASHPITDPKLLDELKQSESRSGDEEVAAPVGVPAAQLAALQAAVKYALSQPAVQAALVKEGFPAGYVDPAQEKSTALSAEAAYRALSADGVKL